MSAITLKVNGQSHTLDLDPATPLLYALSDDLALRGPKFGCGLGQCGACTAIVNGTAMRSCVTPVSAVAGKEIVTLEGARHAGKAPPDSESVHRRAGRPVRVLPERRDPDGEGVPGQESESHRGGNPASAYPPCCAAASRTCGCMKRSSATRRRWRNENGSHDSRRPGRTQPPQLPQRAQAF